MKHFHFLLELAALAALSCSSVCANDEPFVPLRGSQLSASASASASADRIDELGEVGAIVVAEAGSGGSSGGGQKRNRNRKRQGMCRQNMSSSDRRTCQRLERQYCRSKERDRSLNSEICRGLGFHTLAESAPEGSIETYAADSEVFSKETMEMVDRIVDDVEDDLADEDGWYGEEDGDKLISDHIDELGDVGAGCIGTPALSSKSRGGSSKSQICRRDYGHSGQTKAYNCQKFPGYACCATSAGSSVHTALGKCKPSSGDEEDGEKLISETS